jgi:hypothetical protein
MRRVTFEPVRNGVRSFVRYIERRDLPRNEQLAVVSVEQSFLAASHTPTFGYSR